MSELDDRNHQDDAFGKHKVDSGGESSLLPVPTFNEMMTEERSHLTGWEIWNLSFCLLTWACTVSTTTIVVGASNVVILNMGADSSIAALPLGAFFMGSSLISCGITELLFRRCGRKIGFWVGCGVGMLASVLGAVSLVVQSPTLNIISTFFFGATNGIGFFLRFAAVELVPKAWQARAVTLVVSGGVIAAFAGPETGHATRGMLSNDDKLLYMGVYMMTGVFNAASILFIGAVQFNPVAVPAETDKPATDDEKEPSGAIAAFATMYTSLLSTRSFLVPMLISTLFYAIMAVPMTMLRVAMHDAGYSARQSLSSMELHFVGMYAPGFITGSLIERLGIRAVCWVGFAVASVGVLLNLISRAEPSGTPATWILGMFALGAGWSFCFTAATVALTRTLSDVSYSKGEVQSTNDSLMFFLSGIFGFVSGYVYDTGNGELRGWRTLNYGVVVLLGAAFLVMAADWYVERSAKPNLTVASKLDVEDPHANSYAQ